MKLDQNINNSEKKKATDLIPSAGTDDNQSPNIYKNIITNSSKTINKNILKTSSLNEIFDTTFQPKAQIIDGMLQTGAYLFVGSPKIGKSFMMAQIGYHVCKGLPLWGLKTHQGTVLYLALEDDLFRIQQRLSKMFGEEGSDNFYFTTNSERLNDGLEQGLSKFINEHKDTKLIIIDTLQKIREKGNDMYSYANDNDVASSIKRLSEKYNICILIVHHTRKSKSDDPFENISGTNGLLGAVDGAFIMYKKHRNENKAIIDLDGRDVKSQRFYISFDEENCVWSLDNLEKIQNSPRENPLLKKICSLLTIENPRWQGTATELINALELADINTSVLARKLNISVDELLNKYVISYKQKRNHTEKLIILEKLQETVL